MMIRALSATGLLLTLAMLPTGTLAYVSPEEALDDTTFTTRFYELPPTTRELEDRVAEQQRISAERREAELNAVKPQPEAEENMHEAASDEQTDLDKMIELIKLLQSSSDESSTPDADADASASTDLDPVTQRLLLRVQAQQDAAERQSFIESLLGEDGETLHSGAPLADTGPATALITLAVAGAIGETWRRVRKADATTRL